MGEGRGSGFKVLANTGKPRCQSGKLDGGLRVKGLQTPSQIKVLCSLVTYATGITEGATEITITTNMKQ